MKRPLRLIVPLAGTLTIVAPFIGCRDEDPVPVPDATIACRADAACVADPTPRCIQREGCVSTSECPSGMDCQTEDLDAASEAGPSRRCALSRPRDDEAFVLSAGFGVAQMPIQRTPNVVPAELTWTAPPDTVTVECALFTCVPDVRYVDEAGRVAITNYDQCVYLSSKGADRFKMAKTSSDPNTPSTSHSLRAACNAPPTTSKRIVTRIVAGCWAYSRDDLVAASDLVTLQPADVPALANDVVVDCKGKDDGTSCWLDETSELGTCREATCGHRCATADDCPPVEGASADGKQMKCVPGVNGDIGVCSL